ncbi:MAG TPA: permease-like cell division protein FtsX [Thermoanaerobaculia bacterium]|nr:permease-like cell division protein FtsX [Thermoanaerobaculia bacterium]
MASVSLPPAETPSSTFTWFFREALRRIWVSKRTSLLAISMIAISLFIVGACLLVAENLQRAVERWQGKSRTTVYFDSEATPDQIRAVDTYLAQHRDLSARRFVTREQALARFKTMFTSLNDIVDQLDENPFPPSFEIEVGPQAMQSKSFADEIGALRKLPAVDDVQFDWEWLTRLRRLIDIVNVAGLIAGGILAIAAAFTIANVIRLTMLMYREEIEIMRLVGATERIIRGPFLLEGVLQGTIGGAIAVGLLFSAFALTRRAVAAPQSLVWSFLVSGFLTWQKTVALIAGGTLAGWIGSWLSVRERVTEEA